MSEMAVENLKEDVLDALQKKMHVRFRNSALLELALTHSSYVHEHKLPIEQSNERLEFLGDAVLGLCIAEILVREFPNEPEGILSKRRAALVNQKQLARLASTVELGSALRLGRGEEKTGGREKASLLGDAFEAVIGALYLDQGLEAAQKYIERLFNPLVPESKKVETSQDYKTKLQEFYQRKFRRSPRYTVIRETGPDHSKTFEVRIEFAGRVLGNGKGRSKREAEQDAAKNAVQKIGSLDVAPKIKKRKSKSPAKTISTDEK